MFVYRFAIVMAFATYLLILSGGSVHGTGSSLACPDWPLCHGTAFPVMEGGVAVEHSHRLAALTVIVLTLAIAALHTRWATPMQRRLRPFGWLAALVVLLQAALGGITVLLRLPTAVSTAHTANALLFFMVILYIAVRARPAGAAYPAPPALRPTAVRLALITAVALFFQMVLGGLVRHAGAALACLDVPLCRGAIWPHAHPLVLLHVVHRLNALVVAGLVVASSVVTFRAAPDRPGMRALAVIAPVLVAAQIALGIRAIKSFLDFATVEAHLGVATALLALELLVVLRGRPELAPGRFGLRWLVELIRLTKPRITALVVVTFAGGVWLARGSHGEIAGWRVVATLIGAALLVGAANTFNMYLERDVDALMERTRGRPLPRGTVSPEAALVFGTALASSALPLLLLAGNLLTGLLGLLALASYVGVYTPLKRRSPAALFVGALPGAIPPLMGWTTVTGRIDGPGMGLFAILFLWQIPHFLAIAIYGAADYARAGFKVMPLEVSTRATRATVVVSSLALVAATMLLQPLRVAGSHYAACAVLLGALLVGWSAAGLRRAAAGAWARSLFLFSIVYLTLLFVALAADRVA
jgi:protoheme IX farnesyltransferase